MTKKLHFAHLFFICSFFINHLIYLQTGLYSAPFCVRLPQFVNFFIENGELFSKNGELFSKNGELFSKDGELFSKDGELFQMLVNFIKSWESIKLIKIDVSNMHLPLIKTLTLIKSKRGTFSKDGELFFKIWWTFSNAENLLN